MFKHPIKVRTTDFPSTNGVPNTHHMSYRNNPDRSTVPVTKESIFINPNALCENERDKISVSNTDFRLARENLYRAEGRTERGSNTRDGVLNETERGSTNTCQFQEAFISAQHTFPTLLNTESITFELFITVNTEYKLEQGNGSLVKNDAADFNVSDTSHGHSTRTFHTLATPATEKYQLKIKFIHSFPKNLITRNNPNRTTEPISRTDHRSGLERTKKKKEETLTIGKTHASSNETLSGISSSSSSSSSEREAEPAVALASFFGFWKEEKALKHDVQTRVLVNFGRLRTYR
jgi:hypothetical protein